MQASKKEEDKTKKNKNLVPGAKGGCLTPPPPPPTRARLAPNSQLHFRDCVGRLILFYNTLKRIKLTGHYIVQSSLYTIRLYHRSQTLFSSALVNQTRQRAVLSFTHLRELTLRERGNIGTPPHPLLHPFLGT